MDDEVSHKLEHDKSNDAVHLNTVNRTFNKNAEILHVFSKGKRLNFLELLKLNGLKK